MWMGVYVSTLRNPLLFSIPLFITYLPLPLTSTHTIQNTPPYCLSTPLFLSFEQEEGGIDRNENRIRTTQNNESLRPVNSVSKTVIDLYLRCKRRVLHWVVLFRYGTHTYCSKNGGTGENYNTTKLLEINIY